MGFKVQDFELRGSISGCQDRECRLLEVGYCPHPVTAYNRSTIKGLIYPQYEYYPAVTEWGRYPRLRFLEAWGV